MSWLNKGSRPVFKTIASCKVIQDGLGFWIPRRGFWICLVVELWFRISIVSGISDSLVVELWFRIPIVSEIPDSLVVELWFRISIVSGIPDSLVVELWFRISIVSGIPDSLGSILDPQDYQFYMKKIPRIRESRLLFHWAKTILKLYLRPIATRLKLSGQLSLT